MNHWKHYMGYLWLGGTVLLMMTSGCFATMSLPKTKAYTSRKGWIVSAKQAKTLLKQGATILDVRGADVFKKLHVKGALHTTWQHFSEPKAPYQGRLLSDTNVLNKKLQTLGINKETMVLVYGDPAGGWGEDGRIVWMLRTFGHTKSAIVDGGFAALLSTEGIESTSSSSQAKKGNFTITRTKTWEVDRQTLQKQVSNKIFPIKATLIDTRELREFEGKTPYGESRGGHVPGAQHLYYKDLMTQQGYLFTREKLLSLLKQKGIVPGKPVTTYCTGGIRSGWLVVLLIDLGFADAKNYAGSMWEWSSASPSQYPLTTSLK